MIPAKELLYKIYVTPTHIHTKTKLQRSISHFSGYSPHPLEWQPPLVPEYLGSVPARSSREPPVLSKTSRVVVYTNIIIRPSSHQTI